MYYGPIETIDIYNGGEDYDVVNPPKLAVQDSHNSGMNAYAEPVITGSVKDVFVDPSKFDIDNVVSISIEGGNGAGLSVVGVSTFHSNITVAGLSTFTGISTFASAVQIGRASCRERV